MCGRLYRHFSTNMARVRIIFSGVFIFFSYFSLLYLGALFNIFIIFLSNEAKTANFTVPNDSKLRILLAMDLTNKLS